jgi:hypothetical protein
MIGFFILLILFNAFLQINQVFVIFNQISLNGVFGNSRRYALIKAYRLAFNQCASV